ncbi:DsrE family protein [Psychroflexus sp. MES1-P1E]|uniref:DsrE family protein n=1 Tax=Psychroflexus sp. MES1-P1E TaxID=2058320 RepID=UPI000C79D110|nr:DsrE family protein [Psychroflexus sp. MES1-P1E]PKG43393.1 hypothetical protein CXF67_05315 [Psychroflexus sp. MES1-P1E]
MTPILLACMLLLSVLGVSQTHLSLESNRPVNDIENPDFKVDLNQEFKAVAEHNIEIILCGQTSKHRLISKKGLHPDVKIALSAMSALIQLQNEKYALINF